jgi:glucose-6-phosphate 1-dehydrogenase
MKKRSDALSIVVVGASGDLARRKIFPAFFSLYCRGLLPKDTYLFGFARTALSDEQFRRRIEEKLTCRYTPRTSCAEKMSDFLSRCHYVSGRYEDRESFLDLYQAMQTKEAGSQTDRMFYLAIPPSIFVDVARAIGAAGFVMCGERHPWSRVVVEKPFGRDRASSDVLTEALGEVFADSQTFRIDHYLGKEVIQNLLVLRFANLVFEPLWNSRFVQSVEISWKEDLGVEGRGRYFDEYGIIRDVVQNHLLQVLALTAMEPPAMLDAAHIVNEKVRLLRQIAPFCAGDAVVAQYAAGTRGGRQMRAYIEEESVAADSTTPTFFSAKFRVDNDRWRGTEFRICAGKGLDTRATEIRMRFREVEGNMFCALNECPEANELVIRVQPDEAIYLRITNKVPGLKLAVETKDLDLRYREAFDEIIPDAYENLLLDVIRGDRGLFIRKDELAAAWDVVTPLLADIEDGKGLLHRYAFGSTGPDIC